MKVSSGKGGKLRCLAFKVSLSLSLPLLPLPSPPADAATQIPFRINFRSDAFEVEATAGMGEASQMNEGLRLTYTMTNVGCDPV